MEVKEQDLLVIIGSQQVRIHVIEAINVQLGTRIRELEAQLAPPAAKANGDGRVDGYGANVTPFPAPPPQPESGV